jgi:hypothetical protein
MFKISCTKCKKKYELENSACGRQFACSCGYKLYIPVPPGPGNYQLCPDCDDICNDGSVICTGCGYNFQTGKKIRRNKEVKADDDEPGFWLKYGQLIKKAIILGILVFCGFTGYHYYTAKPFGIAPESPMGTFAEVDTFLKELNFDCSESLAPQLYPECKISFYSNTRKTKETRGLIDESIILMSNRSGKVVAAIGNYSIPTGVVSVTGTVVSRFFRRMQEELGVPAKPEFKSVTRGTGMFKTTEDICNWQSSDVKIFWIKVEHAQGLIASTNNLAITIKSLSPEIFFAQLDTESIF